MPTSTEIDLSGIKCPMPIVQLTKLMKTLENGDEIVAVATDPAFAPDVEAWCKRTGHELLNATENGEQITARIRKVDNLE